MRILVTGGGGFVGKALLPYLSEKHSVEVLDRNSVLDKAESADALIHLAATRPPMDANLDCDAHYLSDMEFAQKVFSFALKCGVKQIIHLSSKSVYGATNTLPYNENEEPRSNTCYGRSKYRVERFAQEFAAQNSIRLVVLRPGQLIGSGETRRNVVSTYLANARKGLSLDLWGSGEGAHPYLYIGDLVQLIGVMLERQAEGIYNVAWDKPISYRELASGISGAFGDLKIETHPAKEADETKYGMDSGKIFREQGWKPAYTPDEVWREMQKESISEK